MQFAGRNITRAICQWLSPHPARGLLHALAILSIATRRPGSPHVCVGLFQETPFRMVQEIAHRLYRSTSIDLITIQSRIKTPV